MAPLSSLSVSPLKYTRTIFINQRLVVGLQLVDIRQISGLCVQVEFTVERMEDLASGQMMRVKIM